uniref:Nose resistant-to-fluoxetine protein N-terminal domain-containing protein n=1 Tax=Timema monikensis TaxID=170555 RepID=A0A7R9EFM2_9NEOP|nr:unnamed protein product [Timema monikensis]
MSYILSFMWNLFLFWMYCSTSERVSAEEKLTHSSDHINSLVLEGNNNIGYQTLHSVRNTSNGSGTSSENNVIQTIGNYSNPVNILSIFSNNSSENSSENYLINKYNVDQSSKSDSFEDSQLRFIVENSTGNIAWQIYGVNRSFDNALKFPREMAMGTILKLLKEEQLELYAPITFMTNNDLCNKHLRLYRDSLVSNMSSWALKMFDSSSKLQYGLLTGNIFNLGNFEECLSVNVPGAAHAPLRGQHCIVEVNTRSAKRLFSGSSSKYLFQWSFCIPSTCTADDWKDIHQHFINKTQLPLKVSVHSDNCQIAQDKPFNAAEYTAIIVFGFFGILTIFSTAYDVHMGKSGDRTHLILAFSLLINWKRLTKTDSSPDTLTIIHGIRLFTMGWIMITHQFYIYTEVSAAINKDVMIAGINSHLYNIYLMNGMVAVDSFLLISGLLLSYVFLKTVTNKRTSSFNIPLFYFHRYIRLTPAYAAMILLQVGVLSRLGSGPLFGEMYNKTINACDQYWWAALLYFQNFLKPRNMPVVIVGWVGNILIMLAAQYLIYPIQQPDYVYDRLACSFYFALFRTCWALGVAWIVFSCVAGYGGPVNTLLSWKGWIPLSRLTYCIYLVHLPLIRFQAYSMKAEMYMDIPQQEAAITSLPNGSNEKYQLCSSHLEKSYLARTGADLEQIWHS